MKYSRKHERNSCLGKGSFRKQTKKRAILILKILLFPTIIGLVFLLQYFGIGCLWRQAFGIPCPGCGMTRAFFALLQGDIVGALQYHFMLPAVPILYLYVFFDGKPFKNKYINLAVLTLIIVGFLVKWVMNIFYPC